MQENVRYTNNNNNNELYLSVARNFINDAEVNSEPISPKDEDLLIVKVLNDRKTQQEHLFELRYIFSQHINLTSNKNYDIYYY